MKEHIIISNDRTVIVPASVNKIGNQYEHNVNKVTFDCPRYADDEQTIDLSTMKIYINYIRPDKEPLSSLAENVIVDETDPTIIHFDFRITRNVTFAKGVLSCLVCIKSVNSEGIEEHHWNSDIFTKLTVGEGMENEEVISEENSDLITKLLLEVDTTKAEVNEFSDRIDSVDRKVGPLESLSTEDKSSVVAAVNEVKEDYNDLKGDITRSKEAIKDLSDKKITKFYASNLGETVLNDSDNGKIQDMLIFGKSEQNRGNIKLEDGTTVTVPNPDYPQEIKSVVNPVVKVYDTDGTHTKTASLPYTLNALPVSSGGNVTIDGQQYIADYVDIENKKLVMNVRKMTLTSLSSLTHKVQGKNGEYHYSIGYNMSNALKTVFNTMNGAYAYIMCENTRIVQQTKELAYNENVMSAYGHKDNFEIRLRPLVDDYPTLEELNAYLTSTVVIYPIEPTVTDLTDAEVQEFIELATYYPTTNVIVTSDQLDGYTEFNYPVSLAEGWNYVKQQLGDTRDYIYDMELQSAEAYVNSGYAVTLTELGV